MISPDVPENEIPYCLGLTLEEATLRLALHGIVPKVCISRAPRRPDDAGALRVVWQSKDGSELTVCAFRLQVQEEETI